MASSRAAIVGSEWIAGNVCQGIIPETRGYRHFKLCFNAAQEFEVLAARMHPADSADDGRTADRCVNDEGR